MAQKKRGKILKFNVIKRVKKSLVAFHRSEITLRYYDVAQNRDEEEKIVLACEDEESRQLREEFVELVLE